MRQKESHDSDGKINPQHEHMVVIGISKESPKLLYQFIKKLKR